MPTVAVSQMWLDRFHVSGIPAGGPDTYDASFSDDGVYQGASRISRTPGRVASTGVITEPEHLMLAPLGDRYKEEAGELARLMRTGCYVGQFWASPRSIVTISNTDGRVLVQCRDEIELEASRDLVTGPLDWPGQLKELSSICTALHEHEHPRLLIGAVRRLASVVRDIAEHLHKRESND